MQVNQTQGKPEKFLLSCKLTQPRQKRPIVPSLLSEEERQVEKTHPRFELQRAIVHSTTDR